MKKKVISLFVTGMLAVSMIAGCGSDNTENPDASAPMDKKHIAIGLGLLVILAGALVFFVKNQKEPPKSTAESVSGAEDLEDDFEEDDFVEEVTEVIHEDDKEGMSL